MLAVVMLINRSGTMVVPFLSVYLTDSLGFSVNQAGIMLSCFGIGSMVGAILGGTLTDRYGHFVVQTVSLAGGGIMFILLSSVTEYYSLLMGIFMLSAISESFRPANASSVAGYARPENVARAFSLNRMALNLGFSVGPALGGILAAISYRWLFIADGITSIAAGIFFFFYFRNMKGNPPRVHGHKSGYGPVFKNRRFMAFVILVSIFAVLFFQLFMTLPLYYRQVYNLPESQIGLLLALNGIVVFGLEMIMVYLLNRRFGIHELLFPGMLLMGLSFSILNIFHGEAILYLSMIILSFAEILVMPFLSTFTVQQSNEHNRGAYMGLYTIAFSFALVLSPYLGAQVISRFGFETLWWGTGLIGGILAFGFLYVTKPAKIRLKSA